MTAAGPHSHTPQSQFAARGGAGRLAFGRPALPWLGFSVSEFKLAPGGARAPALQVWRGGACRWLGGAEATWSHLPGPRWRTCSSPPGRCGEGGQVAWRGPKPLAPPERSHGHRRRLESTPGAFCTVATCTFSQGAGGPGSLSVLSLGRERHSLTKRRNSR